MSLYKDYENGGKAYYDKIPRYKNPYSGSNHYDDSNHAAWEKGWKRASQEHNLFTANQTLKAEKEALEVEYASALEENMFLVDDVARLKESAEKMISLISRDSQTIINYRGFISERDDRINALIDSVKKLNKFTFSREKMIIEIKKILNMVHSHLEVISPEVKKNNPK